MAASSPRAAASASAVARLAVIRGEAAPLDWAARAIDQGFLLERPARSSRRRARRARLVRRLGRLGWLA